MAPAAPVERRDKSHASGPPEDDTSLSQAVPSSLKFTISAADVDATFAIHEELQRVIVTMTDRTSGEVLRQIPPQAVLDAMMALRSNGMIVDVNS